MKIVLVFIMSLQENNGQNYATDELLCKTVDLPLGLGSIIAYSRQDPLIKRECEFVNRIYIDTLSSDVIADDILSQAPDLVGFSIHWTQEKEKSVWEIIKNKNSDIKIVLGGPGVPYDVESCRGMLNVHGQIDALLMGEGEIAFRQLLKFYLKKESISNIPNAVLRERGKIFVNNVRVPLNDLSELPSPYLSGDVVLYDNAEGLLNVETSRGCGFHCAYCTYRGREKVRFFNIERFKQEIAFFKSKGFKGRLFITDPILNFNKEWARRVLKVMEGLDFRIHINMRPELIDNEIIELCAKMPKLELKVGIQSINPVALKNINRPMNIAKCREILLNLVRNKIYTGIDLIIGLPGDNYETLKNTFDWAVYCRVQHIGLNELMVPPNSDLKGMCERFEIKCNSNNIELSNYSFSEKDMAKASHFYVGFQFFFFHYRHIFYMLVFKCRYKPSEIVEKFIAEAKKKGEIPPDRLWDLSDINPSDQTVFCFFKSLLNDRQSVEYFFRVYKEKQKRLKDDENRVRSERIV